MGQRRFLYGALIALMMPFTVHAGTNAYQTEITNNVSVGDISIGLEEYDLGQDGELVEYQEGKVVLPGQKIDRIVRIANQANKAWIRAKLEYTSDGGIKGLSDDMVTLSSEHWLKANGYYYYTRPVEPASTIEFIDQVRIPTQWDAAYSDKSFSIVVTADAVQTDHFTPDFGSGEPWFGTIIETSVHSTYNAEHVGMQAFEIAFEGGAEGLVKTGDDFFSNWGNLMPGDTVSDSVSLKNNYGRTVDIYFRSETIADDILLKALLLQIKNGDSVIYSGPMSGAVADKVKIASLGKSDEAKITYVLRVPAELGNQYARLDTKTRWIFSASVKSSGGSSSGGNSDKGSANQGTDSLQQGPPTDTRLFPINPMGTAREVVSGIRNLAKTGDDGTGIYAFAAMLISGTVLVIMMRKKKKGRKGDEKGNG